MTKETISLNRESLVGQINRRGGLLRGIHSLIKNSCKHEGIFGIFCASIPSSLYAYPAIGILREFEGLVGSTVFAFFFVFQHTQIRGVTRLADEVLFYCLPHSTSRFVSVGAIAVFTVNGCFEYFGKVMPYFLFFHIECSEPFDSRSVDNISQIGRAH